MEPHLITPFIHYLPKRTQRRLIRYVTVWGLIAKPSGEQIENFLRGTRLLTRREMKTLFPDGELHIERFMGLSKSFVVYRIVKRQTERESGWAAGG